jgi:hypothetical protein
MTLLAVDDAVRAVVDRLNGGFLQVFDGTEVLAQMRFADPAFVVEQGVATALPLTIGRARQGGVAASWAALDADGVPVLFGKVGEAMLISQRGIDAGADVRVESFTYTQEAG